MLFRSVREQGSGTKKNMSAILREIGLSESNLNRVATVNDVEVTKRLVRLGIGCSLVSNIAVIDEVQRRELLAYPLRLFFIFISLYVPAIAASQLAGT